MTDDDFRALLAFRDGLRSFLRWSEQCAHEAGLTPAQHQLLLAIRGHDGTPSMTDVADHLLLRHHSVVELVDRAEQNGLVQRHADADDQRIVRLSLTDAGNEKLTALSAAHLEELTRLRGSFMLLWRDEAGGPSAT